MPGAHHPTIHQSKLNMTTTSGVWRYLLRNGRFITASIQLAQKHLFRYVSREGAVVFALLSSAAERLLLQLQGLEEDPVITSPVTSPQTNSSDAPSSYSADGRRRKQRRSKAH